jgi:hypothetical protein
MAFHAQQAGRDAGFPGEVAGASLEEVKVRDRVRGGGGPPATVRSSCRQLRGLLGRGRRAGDSRLAGGPANNRVPR